MALRRIGTGPGVQRKLQELADKLGRRATLRVGFLENAKYPDGRSVAMVAAIQDFGAPSRGIPPRPFFRNMVATKQREWPNALASAIVANGFDLEAGLVTLGEGIAGQLRQSIVDTNDPPLAPATVARKGFSKPLVDTAVLLGSIDYEVDVS